MSYIKLESIAIDSLNQGKLALVVVIIFCVMPSLLNLLGVDFASNAFPLPESSVVSGSVSTDVMFYALAGGVHHALLEWSAVCIAVIAALVAFLHYINHRDITVAIVGSALLCAGAVDAFHTLAATRIIESNSPTTDFIPFTWALSRLFNAGVMIIGAGLSLWVASRWSADQPRDHRSRIQLLSLIVCLFLVLAGSAVFWAATSPVLPQTMYSDALITRPFDVLPMALFILSAALFWAWFQQDKAVIKYAFLLSTLPGITTQLHMAFGSTDLFDNDFNVAHFLKIVSYVTILFGVLFDLIRRGSVEEKDKTLVRDDVILWTTGSGYLNSKKATRPLGVRLPLAGFFLTLSISSIVGITFYFETQRLVIEQEIDDLRHESHLMQPLLSNLFEQGYSDVIFMSRTPPVQAIVKAMREQNREQDKIWKLRLERIFTELLNANSMYLKVRYVGVADSGRELLSVVRLLSGISRVPDSRLQQVSSESFFIESKNYDVGLVYYSDIQLNEEHGVITLPHVAVLQVTTPIYDMETGELFGLVAITVDFSQFINKIKNTALQDIVFFLANHHGGYISHPNQGKSFTWQRGVGDLIQQDFPAIQPLFDESDIERGFRDMSFENDAGFVGYYKSFTLSQYGYVKPLRLLMRFQENSYLSAIQTLRNRSLLLAISLSCIALALTIVAVRRVIKPLTDMTEAVQSYELKGRIDQLPTNSTDEIGVLARSFHNLLLSKEQRNTELNETRRYIDSITDAVPILLSYVDKNLTYQFVNKNYERWFNVPMESFIGQSIKYNLGDAAFQKIEPYIESVLSGKVTSFDAEMPDSDGGTRYVHATYTPDIDSDGMVRGFFASIENITKSKRNETELRELSWRLELALKAPGIGVWDYNVVTGELLWDNRMYELYGVDAETFSGAWEAGLHPEDLAQASGQLTDSIESGEDFNTEFRVLWPSGEVRHIAAHAKVLPDSQGQHIRMVGTNYDITEQKTLEQERKAALQQAQESAQLKSDFLASMSHEIRTPMNGVLGMLGLLMRGDLTSQQHHYASLARASADSLLTIINDILDFSKIEAGRLDLELLDFDLTKQLSEFAETMALRAQDKGLELVLDVTKIRQKMVKGDPGRLRQVLTNLVGNAIKFTHSGEIVIRADVQKWGADELILHVWVTDTGIGIPPEKLDGLFDSFTQVDASTTRKYGGTGLGLAIAKQLCELMGGDIRVTSEQGVGSEFSFTVKLWPGESNGIVLPRVNFQGKQVLVVDDNATNREVLVSQLQLWGLRTTSAEDGPSALTLLYDRIDDASFDVAILDMQMPDMDGATLGKAIREESRFDHTRLIMMTSIGESGDVQYFADLGFSAYFPKPATASDLYDALSVVLAGGESLKAAQPLLTQQNLKTMERRSPLPDARLLLVEDNAINQEVALGILDDLGLSADAVGNGIEALEAMRQAPISAPYVLILMDCQMPDMDGYEATRAIRSGLVGEHNRRVPIIAMTANAMKGDREHCLAVGMDDYLSKPIDGEEIEQKLIQWLSPSKTDRLSGDGGSGDRISGSGQPQAAIETIEALPVWDQQQALKRVRGKADRLAVLLKMFVDDMPDRIALLQRQIEHQQFHDAVVTAHTIKGVVGNLSGVRLQTLAAAVEAAAKQQNHAELQRLWPVFDDHYQVLMRCYQQALADSSDES